MAAHVKHSRVFACIPTVNMLCVHATKRNNPIDNTAQFVPTLQNHFLFLFRDKQCVKLLQIVVQYELRHEQKNQNKCWFKIGSTPST
jgi:hypothetical protein